MKYLISGGGTGGHIYPALAIVSEIKAKDKSADILYVGTENGLESELVPRANIDFKTIRVKGMPRKINIDFFIAIKELLLGIKDAKNIINEFKPDVIIGTGGYVCGPVVYIGSKKKVKTLIHEQNAFPGITNKILSRYVDKVLVTFKESKKYFKHKDRVVVTGNPIRKELLEVNKDLAYNKLNVEKAIDLLVSFGGSGGQKSLNRSMYEVIKGRNKEGDLQIIHVTGKRHYEEFMDKLKEDKIVLNKNIQVIPYLYNMPEAINIASLVVTSAGAITLSELAVVGVPSILIPKAYTAENHQEYNAKSFEENGASLVILEKDLDGKVLDTSIDQIISNKSKLKAMSENSLKLGNPKAGQQIADIILDLAKK